MTTEENNQSFLRVTVLDDPSPIIALHFCILHVPKHKLAHPIRTKTMASGGPQPISIECSSFKPQKPQWFWLGFVESTHLIGLLLGFIEIAWFL